MGGSHETVRVPPRSQTRRAVERLAVVVFAGSWLFVVGRLVGPLIGGGAGPLAIAVPVALLLGILLADFTAGCVHWMADRFFGVDTPVIGPALIAPFREHHDDATRMALHDFFEICGSSAASTLPLVWAVAALPPPHTIFALTTQLTGLTLTLALFATNQLHAWAHAPAPPSAVRRLQDLGVILSPARHARHHRGAHDRAYCVTTGWLNPLLDRIGFFPFLESLVAARRPRRRGAT